MNNVHRLEPKEKTPESLEAEVARLRFRLEEAEQTLRAIRAGEVDSLIMDSAGGAKLLVLETPETLSNRLREAMLAQMREAVIATDIEDRITFINAAAEQYYRVSGAAVLGRKLSELYTRHWASPAAEAAAWAALEESGHRCCEEGHRSHDGRELSVEASVAILHDPDTGQRVGLISTIRDITARRHNEAAMRLVNERFGIAVKCSKAVLCQQDLDLRYTWLHNPAPGIEGSDAAGKGDEDLLERAEDATVIKGWKREVIRSGVALRREFFPQIQGVSHCFELLMEPLRDGLGHIIGITAAALDITERKATEAALREATQKAVEANEAKDRFLAAVSHELRTPLMPLMLLAAMRAKSPKLPVELREDFKMIHRNVALEAKLIDDLLDVSCIQQGKMRFDFQLVEVHEVIARTLGNLRADLEAKAIAVHQELRAVPDTIQADPTRVQQVLCNLLRNALKFTPHGGTITVSTTSDQTSLEISVTDTGSGIVAEDIERIFQPFTQVDAQRKSEHRSLGLGLAICSAIVSGHRGRIWAQSPGANHGATLFVRLPR